MEGEGEEEAKKAKELVEVLVKWAADQVSVSVCVCLCVYVCVCVCLVVDVCVCV